MKTLARILHTRPADLFLLVEAFLFLAGARIALKKKSMQSIVAWLRRPTSSQQPADADETALRVQWAIGAIDRRLPGRFVCFPQALAAYAMLHRRGIVGVLNYGVHRSPTNELRAHTWLIVGERTVVGGESAPDFTVVSTFP